MVEFTEVLRAAYPDLDFETLDSDRRRATTALVDHSALTDFGICSSAPFMANALLQVALRRNLELADAFASAFNSELLIPLFILGRSMIETGCVVWDMAERLRAVLDSGDATGLEAIHSHLSRLTLGAKSSDTGCDPDEFEAVNVLTVVQRLDRNGFTRLAEHYAVLSEYAHPNYDGMISAFSNPVDQPQGVTFVDRPFPGAQGELEVVFVSATVGIGITLTAAEDFSRRVDDFVRLCQ